MKYIFIDFEIIRGDFQHDLRELIIAKDDVEVKEAAREHARTFWDADAEETDMGIELFGGEMIVRRINAIEITRQQYELMSSIFRCNNPKQTRVFVVNANEFSVDGGYEIGLWKGHEFRGERLPEKAENFIKHAENKGTVFSLIEFEYMLNLGELNLENKWVFIANRY